jgi:lysophospholipase
MPFSCARALTAAHAALIGRAYVYGGGNWQESWRTSDGGGAFSSDPARDAVHNIWMQHNPALQAGAVTFRWLHEAMKSCALLRGKAYLESINVPCLLTLSGNEEFVENRAIEGAADRLPAAEILKVPGARHELLMEKDEFRNLFFAEFDKLVKDHVLDKPETVKPF